MTDLDLSEFDSKVQMNIRNWLNKDFDKNTKKEILSLYSTDKERLKEAFNQTLSFGTAGIRGIMGVGTNRINIYTVRAATEGLCRHIEELQIPDASVVIGFDNRNNSALFAEETARVLASHKIKAILLKELRPTPFISFCCRHLKCTAAIMITASHNPPEYNGYKVYWENGGQVLPPHDKGIIKQVSKIKDLEKIALASKDDPYIQRIEDELDQVYLDAIAPLKTMGAQDKQHGKELKIIYTNLHGAGLTLIPKALEQWGFSAVSLVVEQKSFDGNYPFAKRPNPEEEEALELGTSKLLEENADLFIATDPDSDRIGLVVSNKSKATRLTGNQVACLCLYHIVETLKLKKGSVFIKTIVTTELFKKIAMSYGHNCIDVLTGFKYIGEQMDLCTEDRPFIFGAEESCGYLLGTHARDKDAIILSCLIAEMALHQKLKGKTLLDLLDEIYEKFGVFRESLISIHFHESFEGKETMQKIMERLREKHLEKIGNQKVVVFEDYISLRKKEGEKTIPLDLPKADVLRYFLEDGTKIVIRPSGTEPKVKVYFGTYETKGKDLAQKIKNCDQKLTHLNEVINAILFNNIH